MQQLKPIYTAHDLDLDLLGDFWLWRPNLSSLSGLRERLLLLLLLRLPLLLLLGLLDLDLELDFDLDLDALLSLDSSTSLIRRPSSLVSSSSSMARSMSSRHLNSTSLETNKYFGEILWGILTLLWSWLCWRCCRWSLRLVSCDLSSPKTCFERLFLGIEEKSWSKCIMDLPEMHNNKDKLY